MVSATAGAPPCIPISSQDESGHRGGHVLSARVAGSRRGQKNAALGHIYHFRVIQFHTAAWHRAHYRLDKSPGTPLKKSLGAFQKRPLFAGGSKP
jgi:hypothetical protein